MKKEDTLCWYCKKCCNKNLCSIVTGTIPGCAKISNNGFITSCADFERDVPAPLQWKDILLLSNCNCIRTFWRKLKKCYERLEKFESYNVPEAKKVIEKIIFFKGLLALRNPLNSNDWRHLRKPLLDKLLAQNCDIISNL